MQLCMFPLSTKSIKTETCPYLFTIDMIQNEATNCVMMLLPLTAGNSFINRKNGEKQSLLWYPPSKCSLNTRSNARHNSRIVYS
jgi:hypothetical protein